MENVNQFFANIGTEQSILILSWLIIAFLLGLLAGYFLRNRYVNELNQLLEQKDKDLANKQQELDQAQQEIALREADLKRAAFETDEAQAKIRRANDDLNRLNQLVASTQAELDQSKAAEQAALAQVGDLNDQVLGLRTRLSEGGNILEPGAETSGLALDRLAAIEVQLARLTEENHQLLRRLGEGSTGSTTSEPTPPAPTQPNSTTTPSDSGAEFFVPKITPAEPAQENPIISSDPSAVLHADKTLLRNVTKDDLTAIDGIGPFLEKKLNDAGIFTYAEVASWDAARIAQVTEQISFFEGRIEKDNWVGQAQKLLQTQQATTVADTIVAESRSLLAPDETIHPVPATDNLKLIMGIDEAIEKILFAAGIDSFAALSRMEPAELLNMLVVVDPKLGQVDPSAWPAQARLAKDEEWEVLQDYQEQLKGG